MQSFALVDKNKKNISVFAGLKEADSLRIFVGPNGNDGPLCGKSLSPCRTIKFAVYNISQAEDIILVDYNRQQPYHECETCALWKSAIIINKSLSVFGYNGTAFIQCRRSCILFEIQGNGNHQSQVEFANLSLSMAQTAVKYDSTSSDLILINCWLNRNGIGLSLRSSPYVSLRVVNSVFQDHLEWGVYSKNCANMSSVFMSCHFLSSPVLLETTQVHPIVWQEFHAYIWNCTFRSDIIYPGCVQLLTIKTVSMATNITIRESIFSNSSGLCGVFSITEATNNHRKTTFITLDKLMVENNWNDRVAVYIKPFFKRPSKFKVKIMNSVFQNNTARTVHAAIKTWKHSSFPQRVYILFSNNTFSKNGYFVHPSETSYSPVLYLDNGRHRLNRCTFVNNYPNGTPNSAVLIPSNLAKIIIEDCLFLKTNTTKSQQIYSESNSRIIFKGTTIFNITAALSDQVIMVHEPLTDSKRLGLVQIRGTVHMVCPPGYHVDFLKNNFHGQVLMWIYFHASCVPCPQKTYSIEKGELKNNITNKIRCYDCPRGAVCESGQLSVKKGFWGHKENDHEVQVMSCPTGYCCKKETCNSYDHCYGHRTGTLCGRCPKGTSEPLFTTKCKINKDCTSSGFWIVFSILLLLYLLFFLFYEEITGFIKNSLPSRQNSNNQPSTQQSRFESNSSSASGYLKIFFFYYQMIHIVLEDIPSGHHVGFFSNVKSFISALMNMIIVNFSIHDCPFKSLRPITKTIFLHSLGFWLLLLIFLTYFVSSFVSWIKPRWRSRMLLRNEDTNHDLETQNSNILFRVRIGCAFTHICLLMYTSSAKLCFSLLNCIQVGKEKVLFIDGTVKCYEKFQYFLMVYIVFSVLPFCFVPVLGCYLLFLKRISALQLYLGCLFPLPYCCYWSYNLIKYHKEQTDIETRNLLPIMENSRNNVHEQALLQILSGPFRSHKSFFGLPNSKIPWEGALILCRLIAILSLTSSNDYRVRAVIMIVICLAMLVFHMYISPFLTAHENFFAALSLCSIIIICVLSLVKAVYHGVDRSLLPENQVFLSASDIGMNALLVIPAALLACLVFMVLFSKLIYKIVVLLKYVKTTVYIRMRNVIILSSITLT